MSIQAIERLIPLGAAKSAIVSPPAEVRH